MAKSNRLDPESVDNRVARQGGMPQPPTIIAEVPVNFSDDPFLAPLGATTAKPPVPETHDDEYLPDRGMGEGVYHGVPPTASTPVVEDRLAYAEQAANKVDDNPYVAQTPMHDPIPVYVVNPASGKETLAAFNAFVIDVPTVSSAILGKDLTRSRVWIRNESDANDVRIGDSTVATNYGWLLKFGEVKEIIAQTEIYAISLHATDSVRLSVLTEHGIPEGV